MPTPASSSPRPANLRGLDYPAEAARLEAGRAAACSTAGLTLPAIIDAHTHIHGLEASRLYDKARRLFGVDLTYSMTQLPRAEPVREALGDTIRFIAIPTWGAADKDDAHAKGYLATIEAFHRDFRSRMMKVWASPRLRDILPGLANAAFGATDIAEIDSKWRIEHCTLAQSLGMMFMVHVADPDTWFATKYTDSRKYGTKRDQYIGLERMLDRFTSPWVAAHMGGWPEDLAFLDGMLTRHPNLYLDTSAMKWVVRELSKHPTGEVRGFFEKWVPGSAPGMPGRILFGTDLVVMDDQLSPSKTMGSVMGDLASSPDEALELYCSRFWALRTLFETDFDGPSNIADPDLHMVEPTRFDALAAPRLRGINLPPHLLAALYRDNCDWLMGRWWREHA
ncbi:MAG: hypothetical protein ACKVS8_07725 [Phycisphaerales bacterium]